MIKSIIHVNSSTAGGAGAAFIAPVPELDAYDGYVVFWSYQEFVELPDSPSVINADNLLVALFITVLTEGAQTVCRIDKIGMVRSWSRPFQLSSGKQGFTLKCERSFKPGQGAVGSHATSPISMDNVSYIDWNSFNTGTWILRPSFDVVLNDPLRPAMTETVPSKWAANIDLANENVYATGDLLWQYTSEAGDTKTLKSYVITRSSKCHVDGSGLTDTLGPGDLPVGVSYTEPPSPTVKWGMFYSTIGTPLAISPTDGDLYWFAIKVMAGQADGGLVKMKDGTHYLESVDNVYYLTLGMVRTS